jgi:hypothetical protein
MADAVHNAEHEFWRAPLPTPLPESVSAALSETCQRCGTEFLMGAGFCHVCGQSRVAALGSPVSRLSSWKRYLAWTRHLEFHVIQERLDLPTASLIAFIAGVGCLVGAIGVGLVFSANTVLDWQAVQLWRIEWLLGATAAFAAGILLKKSSSK